MNDFDFRRPFISVLFSIVRNSGAVVSPLARREGRPYNVRKVETKMQNFNEIREFK